MSRITGKASRHQQPNKLEELWEDLLSGQPEKVRVAYAALETSERKAVLAHLQRMSTEPGWQPEQRLSAKAALVALENQAE